MSEANAILDLLSRVAGSIASVLTLIILWKAALPKLEQIHKQTNSLAEKAQQGAHLAGIQQGLRQAAEMDPAVAAAAKLVLDTAAEKAAAILSTAAPEEKL